MIRRQHRQHIGLRMVDLVKDKQALVDNRCVKEHDARSCHRIDSIDDGFCGVHAITAACAYR